MKKQVLTAVLAASVLIPSAGIAAPLAEVSTDASSVHFLPAAAGDYQLRVSGPEGYSYRETSSAPTFAAFDGEGKALADGIYVWELVAIADKPAEGDRPAFVAAETQSGSFSVSGGSIVDPNLPETFEKAQVFTTDLITKGSNCTGFDCVGSENFGSDTFRLKESNLRIHFDDNSTSATFPKNDWRLTANSSDNGGASYFQIEDATASKNVFRVEAGAPNGSLYAQSGDNVGIGTSNPAVHVHTVFGNSPALRLDQDGSAGFTPQIWDIAGNETNFFIRDVTNGSKLPFRIKSGAPMNAMYIAASGNMGMGTDGPSAQLEVTNTDGDTRVVIEEKSTTEQARNLMSLENNGPSLMRFVDSSADGVTWQIGTTGTGSYALRTGGGVDELLVDAAGNLTVQGTITALTAGSSIPDYVFESDYQLMPLDELAAFVESRKHLPNVPSADAIGERGLNMTEMQVRLLEKVEELTLYTLGQHDQLKEQGERFGSQDPVLEQIEARLAALESQS